MRCTRRLRRWKVLSAISLKYAFLASKAWTWLTFSSGLHVPLPHNPPPGEGHRASQKRRSRPRRVLLRRRGLWLRAEGGHAAFPYHVPRARHRVDDKIDRVPRGVYGGVQVDLDGVVSPRNIRGHENAYMYIYIMPTPQSLPASCPSSPSDSASSSPNYVSPSSASNSPRLPNCRVPTPPDRSCPPRLATLLRRPSP
jgi:hypothetical protein